MACISRRGVLQAGVAASLLAAFKGRDAVAQTAGSDVLWVQVVAHGGWDQMLFTEPKRGWRDYGSTAIRQAGSIPYVDFPEVGPFFRAHGERMLVFNGVDTFTNNHDVGVRHSRSGSLLEGFPVFPAQVAAAAGADRLLPMFTVYDYAETGGLLASNTIDWRSSQRLNELKEVARPPGVYRNGPGFVSDPSTPFLPPSVMQRVAAAHEARTQRLLDAATLPGHRKGLLALARAHAAAKRMPELNLAPQVTLPSGVASSSVLGQTLVLGAAAVNAFKQGLVTTLLVGQGDFDTHGDNDATHRERLGMIFTLTDFLLRQAETANVPMAVVLTSDFGRTVVREGATGTGHWPISTMLVVQNAQAAAQQRLPVDRVIGGTTGDGATHTTNARAVLQARKINPHTLAFDDTGITPTPAHVYRVLRRAAGIDSHASLRDFPLNIDGDDLTV
ncbi:MAG: DUF1501 domain-containing protein [Archangium sp.]|nr:DUF1501 domain-containing protein [Archangium sp.]